MKVEIKYVGRNQPEGMVKKVQEDLAKGLVAGGDWEYAKADSGSKRNKPSSKLPDSTADIEVERSE